MLAVGFLEVGIPELLRAWRQDYTVASEKEDQMSETMIDDRNLLTSASPLPQQALPQKLRLRNRLRI